MTTPVILIGSDATPTYNENAAPVVLDNSLALSDADAPTVGSDIGSATVTITGGFIAGDVLAADATGTAIAVSYSNGVLTLSGADTLADYQAVLKTITFQSSSDNPTDFGAAATRTIEWVVTASERRVQRSTNFDALRQRLERCTDGNGTGRLRDEGTGHQRVVVVPGQRRRQQQPHLFLL